MIYLCLSCTLSGLPYFTSQASADGGRSLQHELEHFLLWSVCHAISLRDRRAVLCFAARPNGEPLNPLEDPLTYNARGQLGQEPSRGGCWPLLSFEIAISKLPSETCPAESKSRWARGETWISQGALVLHGEQLLQNVSGLCGSERIAKGSSLVPVWAWTRMSLLKMPIPPPQLKEFDSFPLAKSY